MQFSHSPAIWQDFPELAAGALLVRGVTKFVLDLPLARFQAIAAARLAAQTEGDLVEIQAWRRAFAKMGLKPTQYRCAAEALLRRFRKEGALPPLHPLVDLCNAVSLAFAIPIAVFDADRIAAPLEVRYATGDEDYLTFSGETEHPEPGEVIFADAGGRAHARRWTNRQSGRSAVREETATALIVAEALHETAPADISRLMAVLGEEISHLWPVSATSALLSRASPLFAP